MYWRHSLDCAAGIRTNAVGDLRLDVFDLLFRKVSLVWLALRRQPLGTIELSVPQPFVSWRRAPRSPIACIAGGVVITLVHLYAPGIPVLIIDFGFYLVSSLGAAGRVFLNLI